MTSVFGNLVFALLSIGSTEASIDPTTLYIEVLARFEPYAESVWHDVEAPPGSGFFGDGQCQGNGGIRGNNGIAVAYATLARFGAREDRQRRVDRVNRALRYGTATHRTGKERCIDGRQWGHSWQSALWAGSLGLAAVLVEDELPPDTLTACRRVIASEADRLTAIPPPSGYVGDSKAEENAWNSNVLALAAAWMPEGPRAIRWLHAGKTYLSNTYTVPENESGPLRDWINTTTLYPSFTVENHGFFHPSYLMVAGMSLGDSLLMARLTDPSVAEELRPFAEHNVLNVWDSLSHVLLDSGDFAYPSGLDWALHGYVQVSYYAWLASHYKSPLATWAESKLAPLIADRQRCTGDGRFFGRSVPNGFFREAVLARRVAIAFLHHETSAARPQASSSPEPSVAHWPDVKVILHRSPHGFTAISYGARVMAQVVPTSRGFEDQPYIVTPRLPGIFGSADDSGNIDARLRRYEIADQEFTAVFEISREGRERTFAIVESRGDIVAVLEVPAAPVKTQNHGSGFPIGIENHPLTGGSRRVAFANGAERVSAFSGRVLRDLESWANIDDRLGMIVGPGAQLEYRAAADYNRRGAAEDTLHASGLNLAMPRYVIFLPGATSQKTKDVFSTVKFVLDRSHATLNVVSPSQEKISLELEASLTRLPQLE